MWLKPESTGPVLSSGASVVQPVRGVEGQNTGPAAGTVTKRVYWLDLNRFDLKPDQSTWLEMSANLRRLGYPVTLLVGRSRRCGEAYDADRDIHYFRSLDLPLLFRITLQFNILVWLLRYSRRDDIVMLSPGALLIAPCLRLLGWKHLHLDFRTLPVEVHSPKDRLDRILYWLFPVRWLAWLASGYSFITRPLQAAVEQEFGRSYSDSVVWSSGVNCEKFAAVDLPHHSGSVFTFFYHGSVSKKRGLIELVEAIASLDTEYRRRLRLVVVGRGNALDSLRSLVANQGLEDVVELKGFVPYEAIQEELAAADCCVCPLPDLEEWRVSSPLKVFEYLAAARPVLLTPIAAHRALDLDEAYVVWATGDGVPALRSAIIEALERRESLRQHAAEARSVARARFDWQVQAGALGDFFGVRYV